MVLGAVVNFTYKNDVDLLQIVYHFGKRDRLAIADPHHLFPGEAAVRGITSKHSIKAILL